VVMGTEEEKRAGRKEGMTGVGNEYESVWNGDDQAGGGAEQHIVY